MKDLPFDTEQFQTSNCSEPYATGRSKESIESWVMRRAKYIYPVIPL